jgi:hypothetical protein
VATLPIHALFTAYVAEDTPLRSKQYIVTAVTTISTNAANHFNNIFKHELISTKAANHFNIFKHKLVSTKAADNFNNIFQNMSM